MPTGLPAVIIHSLRDGERVLGHGLPVCLLSAPGAALYAGAGWWRALILALCAGYPEVDFTDGLDCADAPGRAAEALRTGQRRILFYPDKTVLFEAVRRLALAYEAEVWSERPAALDMAERGAERRLAAWLSPPAASG